MEVNNLYRKIIMEHYKDPKNKGLLEDSSYLLINMTNPSCGDNVVLQLKQEDGIIKDIRHEGVGCSICCSAASMISEILKNKTKEEALDILDEYHLMIKGESYSKEILNNDLIVYEGVAKFPARIRCATLASRALEEGLLKKEDKHE